MPKNKHDIRFSLKIDRNSEYFSFKAWVVYLVDPDPGRADDSGVRNPIGWDHHSELVALADLCVSAQANRGALAADCGSEFYGWDLEYRSPYAVDLRRAESMVKQLRANERKMAKLIEQFGQPNDLADFCARAAKVVGATSRTPFGIWHDQTTINGTHYRWVDVDGLRSWIHNTTTNRVKPAV